MADTKKKHRQLRALFNRQNGQCHWCGRDMMPPWVWREKANSGKAKKMPEHLCTLDHLDDRLSGERGRHYGEYRRVAACWRCNTDRGRESQKRVPIEWLWHKAGHIDRMTGNG